MFRSKFRFRPLGEAQGQVIERQVLSVHKRAFKILSDEIPAGAVPGPYVVKMNLTTF
jgi:hypothetical protein